MFFYQNHYDSWPWVGMFLRGELGDGPLDSQLRALWAELNSERKHAGKGGMAGSFIPASVGMDNMCPLFKHIGTCDFKKGVGACIRNLHMFTRVLLG